MRNRPLIISGSAVLICLLSSLPACGNDAPTSGNNCPRAPWCTDPVNHNRDPYQAPYHVPYKAPPEIEK
jgi:hypothetical protein